MTVPILHTEVGGSYGGSFRALELLLKYSDRSRFSHDVMFYYPTPGSERLICLARKVWTLYEHSPDSMTASSPPGRSTIKRLAGGLAGVRPWLQLPGQFRIARRIAAVLKRADYQLVHVNNTFSYQSPTLMAARMARLPVVSHQRSSVVDCTLNRRLMRLTNYIAAVNHCTERQLSSWGTGVTVKTCYDPVECPEPNKAAVADLRRSLVPEGGVLIGSIGRLDRVKGFADLLHAARVVLDRYPQARFAIAGEGPERVALEQLVRRLGLAGQFILCGFRPDFSNFLAALDLFVCSSLREGIPLALVEAILLWKPVVSTDVGGIAEILGSGGATALVSPGDPGELARAIMAAIGEDGAVRQPTAQAREVAMRLTNPFSTTRELEDVFLRVLSARPRGRRGRENSRHKLRFN